MARSNQHRRKVEKPARRVVVRIEDIGAGGDGVATLDGARLFVPLTAPGDLAEIDARGDRGTLVSLKESGAVRAPAPCRHYGQCGGCSLQHIRADFYRQWKHRRVVDALTREGLGGLAVEAVVETPAASRRRASFAVKKQRGGVVFGFNARRSSMIATVDGCLILHPLLEKRLPALRALAAKIDAAEFDLTATLCDNGLDVAIAGAAREPRGPALVEILSLMRAAGAVRLSFAGAPVATIAPPLIDIDGVALALPPGAFLQASREGETALAGLVKDAVKGARKIADLFAGCGTFALPLARSASVYAADSNRAAIDALVSAAAGAQANGLHPLNAEARDLFERPLMARELKTFDAIVFDPPRAGALMQAAEIAASGAPRVVGVSCNPASFARDAAILVAGGYRLERVTPVDQFVWSAHVELVGVFRARSA